MNPDEDPKKLVDPLKDTAKDSRKDSKKTDASKDSRASKKGSYNELFFSCHFIFEIFGFLNFFAVFYSY